MLFILHINESRLVGTDSIEVVFGPINTVSAFSRRSSSAMFLGGMLHNLGLSCWWRRWPLPVLNIFFNNRILLCRLGSSTRCLSRLSSESNSWALRLLTWCQREGIHAGLFARCRNRLRWNWLCRKRLSFLLSKRRMCWSERCATGHQCSDSMVSAVVLVEIQSSGVLNLQLILWAVPPSVGGGFLSGTSVVELGRRARSLSRKGS